MKTLNAYDIVDKIIASKVNHISDRELDRYGEISSIVLEILKVDYNAHYVADPDPHFCGDWYFNSPFWKEVKAYQLQYCDLDTTEEHEWRNEWLSTSTDPYPDYFISDIIRSENNSETGLYWKHERNPEKYETKFHEEIERIRDELKNHRMYVGNKYAWRVIQTTANERIGK